MSELAKYPRKLDAAIEAFRSERLRWVMGLSVVGAKASETEHYNQVAEDVLIDEMRREMLLVELKKKGPLTMKELSESTGLDRKQLLDHMLALRKRGAVTEVGEKENEYIYKAV
jgi:predicted Rossmann fold nucleotide-binding protein DprA/Smf involved in DNA uptake